MSITEYDTKINKMVEDEFGHTDNKKHFELQMTIMRKIAQGDIKTMSSLATLYTHGYQKFGIPENIERANFWHKQAADKGSAEDSYYYATYMLWKSDCGRLKEYQQEGIRYLVFAADNGYPPAQKRLGIAYTQGLGVEISYRKAYSYLCVAQENGEDVLEDLQILLNKMRS